MTTGKTMTLTKWTFPTLLCLFLSFPRTFIGFRAHPNPVRYHFKPCLNYLNYICKRLHFQIRSHPNLSFWVTLSNPPQMSRTLVATRTSLAVQWLRLCASNAGGMGSIPGQGIRFLQASWWSHVPQIGTQTQPKLCLGLEPTCLGRKPSQNARYLVSGASEAQVLDVSSQKEFSERHSDR